MTKLALIATAVILFSGCYSTKRILRSGDYTCNVYSYTDIFTELDEDTRYLAYTKVFRDNNLVFEQEFAKSGDSADSKEYFYGATGLLDSMNYYRPDITLKTEYSYVEGQIDEVVDFYWGKRDLKVRHLRTDTSHTEQHYLGGRFSHTRKVYYDTSGQRIKEDLFDPYGNYWGKYEYSYTRTGKVASKASFNKSNVMDEITTYEYDKHGNLFWEIIKTDKGKLLEKFRYEYHK